MTAASLHLRPSLKGGAVVAGKDAEVQTTASVPEFLRPLERWLAQAGPEMPVLQFLTITCLCAMVGILVTAVWLNGGIACVYGSSLIALPSIYVVLQRKRRLATFSEQLPYIADFLRSTLRAGHPLARGLQMATENAPEPMATELRLATDQMRYGASLLRHLTKCLSECQRKVSGSL